jgi:MFS family permease
MTGQPVELRRARLAAAGLFLTNGALFANLVPRYPEIKADLALSNTGFGAAVAAFSAGALVSGLAAAALIRRFGSASLAVFFSLGLALFTIAAGAAPSGILLAGALFWAGAADSVTDVAQNAQGLRVQREYGRSIINSLHAVWSAGAVLGGLIGAGAIQFGVNRVVQLSTVGAVSAVVCIVGHRFLLSDDTDESSTESPSAARRRTVLPLLAAFVAIALAGALIEDAGASWSTIYLRDILSAPPALAAFGFIAVVGSQFVGRAVGDRLVDRFGQRAVVAAGGAIAALGMGSALMFPSVPGSIAGFALAGFGSATMVPGAMHAADQLPGLRPGTGLTILTWFMRVGFLLSPLIVGTVADEHGLRVALLTVPVAGVAAVLLAQVLASRQRSR